MTSATRLVLGMFLRARLEDASTELYGVEICTEADLGPGTVYPILARLSEIGWLEERLEAAEEGDKNRPRRNYYRLTDGGAIAAQAALASAQKSRRVTNERHRKEPRHAWLEKLLQHRFAGGE